MQFDFHYLFLIASVICASVSQILLKKGAMQEYPSFLREYVNPWVIGGYGLLFGSVFLTIMGLRGLSYFNAPVVESLGYVLVPILSAVFFHEKMTLRKSVGIGCIVAGMVIFTFEEESGNHLTPPYVLSGEAVSRTSSCGSLKRARSA